MEVTLIHAVLFVVVLQALGIYVSMRRAKNVWVVEDCESDIQLYKLNLEVPECHIKYFRDITNIGWSALFNRPDGVIVDYMLKGTTRGDELFKFCEKQGIPTLLVTGYEGEILGIPPKSVVAKSQDQSHFKAIERWIESQVLPS